MSSIFCQPTAIPLPPLNDAHSLRATVTRHTVKPAFVINHSKEYTGALLAAWFEFCLEGLMFPALKRQPWVVLLGVCMVLAGHWYRIGAMCTAGANFNHEIMQEVSVPDFLDGVCSSISRVMRKVDQAASIRLELASHHLAGLLLPYVIRTLGLEPTHFFQRDRGGCSEVVILCTQRCSRWVATCRLIRLFAPGVFWPVLLVLTSFTSASLRTRRNQATRLPWTFQSFARCREQDALPLNEGPSHVGCILGIRTPRSDA